jgi:hypothetical protein
MMVHDDYLSAFWVEEKKVPEGVVVYGFGRK